MKHFFGSTWALGVVCLTCITGHGQEQKADTAAKAAKVHVATYIDAERLPLGTIVPPPPAGGSETAKAEFQELHRIQAARTPQQVKAAQADDAEEDIFIYRTVLGAGFSAQALPLTATLSSRVHGDEPIASNPLKDRYQRPRPYQIDSTLHPVCKVTDKHNSYPSGHSVSGYLLALTLVEMVPEKSAEILARADEYAHNRLVCGVHTASDLEASRLIAYAMFGSMMQEPRFQQDLQASRTEIRHALGLTR